MATREKLLEAAAQAFAEGGYHGATLAKVGQRLGLSKSAVLYHFDTKEQLLDEMLEPVVLAIEDIVHTTSQPPESLEDRLILLHRLMSESLDHAAASLAIQVDRNLWRYGTSGRRILASYLRIIELLAGPDPTAESSQRAAAAVSLAFRAVTTGLDGQGPVTSLESPTGCTVLAICSDVLEP